MRDEVTLQKFVDSFSGSFSRRSPVDEHYWIYDQLGEHIAYAIVEHAGGKSSNLKNLSIEAPKLLRLTNKRFNPLVIWELGDGIAYIKASSIFGSIAMDHESMEYIVHIDPKNNPVKFIS